jgi:hypothetical protein
VQSFRFTGRCEWASNFYLAKERKGSVGLTRFIVVVLLLSVAFASLERGVAIAQNAQVRDRKVEQPRPRSEALKRAKTSFVEFETSPFPYDGVVPDKGTPFLDVTSGERRGHRTHSGRVLWEDTTFRERRVLLHIPRGFDFTRPGVMVVFFHGHGATLRRDIRDRQLVPAQVAASGTNAVLVAPQFAYNAADSSAGKFWQRGAFAKFVGEAADRLAELHGNPSSADAFAKMPIVIVAYSGGYLAAASCLDVGGVKNRFRGVVLLDALYGELDKFTAWIANNKNAFFVSSYTDSTENKNNLLKTMLKESNIVFGTELKKNKLNPGVTFVATNPETKHEDFVTQAWVEYPVKDILRRLDEFRRQR